jgi:hypothetical protein
MSKAPLDRAVDHLSQALLALLRTHRPLFNPLVDGNRVLAADFAAMAALALRGALTEQIVDDFRFPPDAADATVQSGMLRAGTIEVEIDLPPLAATARRQ